MDFIKLWMDDHLGTKPKMPYEIAQAIIVSAHRHHLRVVAHIFYLQDAKQLVDYGVDGLAHSVRDKPVDQAFIQDMKRYGTWQMAATLSREASMFVYGANASVRGRSILHPQRLRRCRRQIEEPCLPGDDPIRS